MLRGIWNRIRTSRAALNAGASYLAVGSIMLRGLIAIPIAIAFLDKEQLGMWAVTSAVMGYLVWTDLGIGSATGRLIADAVYKRDQEEINAWWSTTRIILLLLGLLVILCSLPLVPLVVGFFGVSPANHAEAQKLMYGAILVTGLSFPLRGVPGLLTAQNRFHLSMLAQVVTPWVNLGVFYLLLRAGWGLVAYVGAMAASQLATWVLYYIFIITGPDRPRFSIRGFERRRIGRLFTLSGSMTVIGFVDSVLQSLPAFIIGRLGALTQVPVYTISLRGPEMGLNLGKRTLQSFYPGLQRLHIAGNSERFLKQHERVLDATLAVALFCASGILLCNSLLIDLLAGAEFFVGPYVNVWFALVVVTNLMSGCYRILLLLSGSMERHALVAMAKLVCAVVLGILGWRWGGYAGLAVVFAFLPLFNGVYCYYKGSAGCGYTSKQTGGAILPWIAAGCASVVAAGFLQASLMSPGTSEVILVLGKTINLPSILPSVAALLPALLGGVVVIKLSRSAKVGQVAEPT